MMTLPVRFTVPLITFVAVAAVLFVFLYRIQVENLDPKTVPSVLIGKPAPTFSLTPPQGLKAGLGNADLKGRVTVVNVFASWCVPCLAEHPIMMQLSKDPSIAVVGINYKDKDDKAVAWLNDHGNPYVRVGADRKGRVSIDWGVYGVPETFIVDRDGVVRFKHVGPLTPAVLRDRVLPMLAKLKK